MYKETHLRSIIKTISWRALATLTTMSLVYIFIGDMTIALSVGGIEVVLKMLVYFVHERAWDKIKFGRKEYKPAVIWITGLVRSGKAEIASALVKDLEEKGMKVEFLNGHNIRNLFPETGFSREEVNEHVKRVGYLASRLEKRGIFVVASFVSPYAESREFVRNICDNFVEIHVSTPLEICEQNDDSGIYKKAREGKIKHLAGVDVEYEIPENPLVRIDTSKQTYKDIAPQLMKTLL